MLSALTRAPRRCELASRRNGKIRESGVIDFHRVKGVVACGIRWEAADGIDFSSTTLVDMPHLGAGIDLFFVYVSVTES